MTLEKHALKEFKAAGWLNADGCWKDESQEAICKNVLAMLKIFSEGHLSGSSASYALSVFMKLASFEPLAPLTGDDSEWMAVSEKLQQNTRCGRVFKGADGKAYDIEGKVFEKLNGQRYTNSESNVHIEFPYVPKTEYVLVEDNDVSGCHANADGCHANADENIKKS